MSNEAGENTISWIRDLLNGLLAWILGFVVYLSPGLVVSLKMGFELGPTSDDPAAVSEQISQTISGIYQHNPWLTVGFMVVTALLIFWRAKKVSRSTGEQSTLNGLLVATFPVLFSLLSIQVDLISLPS